MNFLTKTPTDGATAEEDPAARARGSLRNEQVLLLSEVLNKVGEALNSPDPTAVHTGLAKLRQALFRDDRRSTANALSPVVPQEHRDSKSPKVSRVSISAPEEEGLQKRSVAGVVLAEDDQQVDEIIEKKRLSTPAIKWEEIEVVAESQQSHKYIIRPTSRLRMVWDLMALVLVLLDSVVLPFEISFLPDSQEGALFFFGVFFFSIDIVLNFLTGYYHRGVLILNQTAIIRNYLRTWFLLDFGSTVPFSLFFEDEEDINSSSTTVSATPAPGGGGGAPIGAANLRLIKIAKLFKLLRLMRLLRLLKFRKIVHNIEAYFNSMVVIHMFNILSIFLMILFFCHWNACLWWSVGHAESFFNSGEEVIDWAAKNTTTLPRHWTELLITYGGASYRWLERPLEDQYVFCFYWTLGVMRTMPSEVWPVSFKERLYTMCFMFVAFSMFAISISKITAVFNKIGRRRAAFDERMASVRMYMREKDVSPPLQEKIQNYLEYIFNKKQILAEDLGLLGDLSVQLKGELSLCFLSSLLRRHPAFTEVAETHMRRLASIVHTSFGSPGEVIVSPGEVVQGLTMVSQGSLLVVMESEIQTYYAGECRAVEMIECAVI